MAVLKKKEKLGDIFVASNMVTDSEVTAALEKQARTGCRFGEALVNLGVVSQEDVEWALSSQLDIPYIRLKRELINPEAIAFISGDIAWKFLCIPLFLAENELNVAIADPLNVSAVKFLELRTGFRVSISVATVDEITKMINEFYGSPKRETLGFESPIFSPMVLEVMNADLSGSRLLDSLLISIIKNQFVSLSLQPTGERIVVRGKRDGFSREIGSLPLDLYPNFIGMLRKKASIIPTTRSISAGSLSFAYRTCVYNFHVTSMETYGGDLVTFRLENSTTFPENISEFALSEDQLVALRQLVRAERGITFFASHSARARNHIMRLMLKDVVGDKNVIALGNEYEGVRSAFPHVPFPYEAQECARLIHESLEHDPDILVVQELHDGISMRAVYKAAMRGVRVLAGLDLRGTADALRHLLFHQRHIPSLPLLINGVISSATVSRLCPHCREPHTPTSEELATMSLESLSIIFYHSKGCDVCGDSGFKDQRLLLETEIFTDELRQIFRKENDASSLEKFLVARRRNIAREGAKMLTDGEISPEEYFAAIAE